MPKGANQKLKLLYLAQLLQQKSDEEHPLTVGEMITALAAVGIDAERKSIYDDMEALQRFGLDVVTVRGRSNAYYLGQREFELPELKLLVDAVESAKFVTAEKSRALIQKICALASQHQGSLMQRQVHMAGRAKTVNQRTYYNVDAIHSAIAGNGQLSFQYFKWELDLKAARRLARKAQWNGRRYRVSPYALLWDDEYYYLVAYDAAAQKLKHYRVDRMDHIRAEESPRLGQEAFAQTDLAAYSQSVFGMFGGARQDVRLRFSNRLLDVAVDRFGTDLFVQPSGEGHFEVTVQVVVSPQFFGWLFGLGGEAAVVGPPQLVRQTQTQLEEIAALYAPATGNGQK